MARKNRWQQQPTNPDSWKPFVRQQQKVIRIAANQPDPAGSGGGVPEPPAAPSLRDIQIPIDIGMYNTISVIEALKVRYPIPQFMKDMFFGGRDFSSADVVQIDVKRGGRRLAPFVLPMEGQVVERRRPFIRTFIEAPTLAPARVITLRELSRPFWGETSYDYFTPEERVANMYAEDTEEMDDEIARTEEWMCCDCMFNGRIRMRYRNQTEQILDYGFNNVTVLTQPWFTINAAGVWQANPDANPLDDLHALQGGLNANGYSGNTAVYSPLAWRALWNHPTVRATMQHLSGLTPVTAYRMPEALPAGVAQAPSFTYPVMDNYVYSGHYTEVPSGSAVETAMPMIPENSVLVGSSDVKNRLIYAIVMQIEQEDHRWHSYMSDRVPKVEANVNKNLYMYTMTARPVPVPIDLLSWTVLRNVFVRVP